MMPTGMCLKSYRLMALTIAWLSIGSEMIAAGLRSSRLDHCCNCTVLSKLALTVWNSQPCASTARLTPSCCATKK